MGASCWIIFITDLLDCQVTLYHQPLMHRRCPAVLHAVSSTPKHRRPSDLTTELPAIVPAVLHAVLLHREIIQRTELTVSIDSIISIYPPPPVVLVFSSSLCQLAWTLRTMVYCEHQRNEVDLSEDYLI